MMESIRIMLVEDSGILVSDIIETIDSDQISIDSVHKSAEEALDELQSETPDLVLMDINLKGEMDGVAATERIREQWDIPVVYLTAYSNEKYMDRVKQSDALAFLVKPLEKNDLQSILNWIQSDRSGERPTLKRGDFLPAS